MPEMGLTRPSTAAIKTAAHGLKADMLLVDPDFG